MGKIPPLHGPPGRGDARRRTEQKRDSKPPSWFQIPFRACAVRIAVVITAPTRMVPTGVRGPALIPLRRIGPPASGTSAEICPNHAAGAVAALGGLLVNERLLDGVKPTRTLQPLHRGDRPHDSGHGQVARWVELTVDEHEACPTLPHPAAKLRSGQPHVMAEHVEQRGVRLTRHGDVRAIYGQPEFSLHRSYAGLPASIHC